MPSYKLQKKGKSARRVEVRAERIDIHVPALIICAVIAFLIWLYVVGFSHIPTANPNGDSSGDTTPPVEAVVDPRAENDPAGV